MNGNNFNSNNQNQGVELTQETIDINLIDFTKYLFTNRYILGLVSIIFPLFIGVYSHFVKKPVYKAKAVMNVDISSKASAISGASLSYWFQEQEITNKVHMTEQLFWSVRYRKALAREVLGLTNHSRKHPKSRQFKKIIRTHYFQNRKIRLEDAAGIVIGPLNLLVDEDRNNLTIVASASDPVVSMSIANLASMVLVALNYDNMLKQGRGIKEFIKDQTEVTKNQLTALEDQLVSLQKEHKILSVDDVKSKVNNDQLALKERITLLNEKIAANSISIAKFEMELKHYRDIVNNNERPSHQYLSQLQKRLERLKYQQNLIKEGRQPASVDSKEVKKQVRDTMNEFSKAISRTQSKMITVDPWNYIETLEKKILDLKQLQKTLQSEMKAQIESSEIRDQDFQSLPPVLQRMNQLKRSMRITTELYDNLQSRLQETEIQDAGRTNDLILIGQAEMPGIASGMSMTKKYIISFIAGLIIAIITLLLRYILVPTIREENDLKRHGVNVVGGIPWYKPPAKNLLNSNYTSKAPLILHESPNSYEANAIRFSRFKLQKSLDLDKRITDNFAKVISVCSVNHKEGRTFTVANIAHALSLAEFKVLLIDLDLGNPMLHRYFPDVTDPIDLAIVNEDSRVNFIRHQVTEHLHLIDAPKVGENVCDYLESDRFRRFLVNLREEYDVILIDTPPIDGHLEPILATQQSDSILFVANQRKTLRQDLLRAYNKMNEHFKGQTVVLLNFVLDEIKISFRRKAG